MKARNLAYSQEMQLLVSLDEPGFLIPTTVFLPVLMSFNA